MRKQQREEILKVLEDTYKDTKQRLITIRRLNFWLR